jgi:hypothetical protein
MKLLLIHGGAACGKLTVARELEELTGFPVFHNHLVVDAVASVFPFGSDRFISLREMFWLTIFREAAEAGRSLIFTFTPEATVAPDFLDRVRKTVGNFSGELIRIRLTVPVAEQERRIANPDRGKFGKLRSVELLRQLRPQFVACEAAMPPPALTIDTSVVEPTDAARLIVSTFGLKPIWL